jgi:GDP-L-fucose synthase
MSVHVVSRNDTHMIRWNTSKPDGTPRKWMDTSRLSAMGWKPETGLRLAYEDFLKKFPFTHP